MLRGFHSTKHLWFQGWKTYDFKVDQSKIDPSSTTPAETPSGEYPENHFVMKQATNATLTPTDSKRLFSEYEIVNLYIEFLCFFL